MTDPLRSAFGLAFDCAGCAGRERFVRVWAGCVLGFELFCECADAGAAARTALTASPGGELRSPTGVCAIAFAICPGGMTCEWRALCAAPRECAFGRGDDLTSTTVGAASLGVSNVSPLALRTLPSDALAEANST